MGSFIVVAILFAWSTIVCFTIKLHHFGVVLNCHFIPYASKRVKNSVDKNSSFLSIGKTLILFPHFFSTLFFNILNFSKALDFTSKKNTHVFLE
jgi:hypothetical protein